jgi:hypothetical protein
MWTGWTVWGLVLLWLGRRHPIIHDPHQLTSGRTVIGWLALAVFLLCFALEPIRAGGL